MTGIALRCESLSLYRLIHWCVLHQTLSACLTTRTPRSHFGFCLRVFRQARPTQYMDCLDPMGSMRTASLSNRQRHIRDTTSPLLSLKEQTEINNDEAVHNYRFNPISKLLPQNYVTSTKLVACNLTSWHHAVFQ